MTWFQGTYTQRFNVMFQRRGHVYQDRYKAIPVYTDPRSDGLCYFRQLSSYIHLNPYRAGSCGEGKAESLESYIWSSYLGGEQKRAHNEREAEMLIKAALTEFGINEKELLEMETNRPEKQAVAWLVKAHTTVSGKWVTERLQMGHPSNISRSLKRFRTAEYEEIQILRNKMTKCKS